METRETQRISPRPLGLGWIRIHDPQCTNAPCDCADRGALIYECLAPVIGDCVSCDGYVLHAEDAPHCPTCARLLRCGQKEL